MAHQKKAFIGKTFVCCLYHHLRWPPASPMQNTEMNVNRYCNNFCPDPDIFYNPEGAGRAQCPWRGVNIK